MKRRFCLTNRKDGYNMYSKFINELQKNEYSLENIHEVAAKVLERFEVIEIPVPIVSIVKKFGFQVYEQTMEDMMSGFIVVDKKWKDKFKTDKLILVNSEHNNGHKRFTIAHELGHYLIDYRIKDEPYYNAYYKNTAELPEERCANQFAANLLMPRTQFIDEYNAIKNSDYNIVASLAEKFAVSARAVEMRMEELRLG